MYVYLNICARQFQIKYLYEIDYSTSLGPRPKLTPVRIAFSITQSVSGIAIEYVCVCVYML